MEKKIEKVAILVTAVFMLVLVASSYPALAATVSIESVTLGEGENTTVPIFWINNTVDEAKGATINLTYNASVVHVIDFGNSDFNLEVYSDVNNVNGYFLCSMANYPLGLTGNITFVEVTLEAVGNAEDQSPLNLTVLSLNNGTGPDSIPRDVINGTFTIPTPTPVFDTGSGTYPSISGTHNGTITPSHDIVVSKMYTYPCPGTGGHSEYVKIWNASGTIAEGNWTGYEGDWHIISFDKPFILKANETYNYTIRTGSYPQIIHNPGANVTGGGTITCEEFVDANGKSCNDWIPAIKLYSTEGSIIKHNK